MASSEASVSSSSSKNVTKVELKDRKKRLKIRKELDEQHNRLQHLRTEEIFVRPKTPEEQEIVDIKKKKRYSGKYDLDLDPDRKFTIDLDLEFYALPDFNDEPLTLEEQNDLLKHMMNIPQNAPIPAIRAKIKTAKQLREEKKKQTIVYSTGIAEMDDMLGGYKGIASGEVVEFCGMTGTGKSLMILTLLVNILSTYKKEKVIYFDTRTAGFSIDNLIALMDSRHMDEKQKFSIISRIKIIRTKDIKDITSCIQQLIDPESAEDAEDIRDVRFIIFDSITVPLFRASTASILYNKTLITVMHSALKQLSLKGFISIVSNIGLHKYNIYTPKSRKPTINEDDENKADSKDEKRRRTESETSEQDVFASVFPALDASNWNAILDYRFMITAAEMHPNVLGFIESTRKITLTSPPTMKSFSINFAEVGFESNKLKSL